MQNIIAIENGVTRHPLYRMKEPVNMTLAAAEHNSFSTLEYPIRYKL